MRKPDDFAHQFSLIRCDPGRSEAAQGAAARIGGLPNYRESLYYTPYAGQRTAVLLNCKRPEKPLEDGQIDRDPIYRGLLAWKGPDPF